MSRATRYGFILAKIYGIMARSYLGKNYRDILRLKNLNELRDRLFPAEKTEGSAKVAPEELEAEIVEAGIASMTYVLDYLREPVPILVHVLRRHEYANVKSVLRGLGGAAQTEARSGPASEARFWAAPEARFWDLGAYASLRRAEPRDREAALKKSPYAWVLPLIGTMPLSQVENRLDQDYHARFLSLAQSLPAADRAGVVRMARLEIALANVIWALRLRFYYGLEWERARKLLVLQRADHEKRALERIFEMQPDATDDWRRWRYGWLLSDQLAEGFRAPDPVRAEQKASQALYLRYRHAFHQDPFTLCPIVAYFKLKEHEASLLTTAVEALELSVPEQDVMTIVGAR